MWRTWPLAAICLASCLASLAAAPATQPIAPQAAHQLALMSQAYRNLKSLSVSGTLSLATDIDGQKSEHQVAFSGSFTAPFRFRHEIKDDLLVVGTGEKVYAYVHDDNAYTEAASPPRGGLDDLDEDLASDLRTQDLSLALALSEDPAAELTGAGATVTALPDVAIDGRSYPALMVWTAGEDLTAVFDPVTHLLRRGVSDKSRALSARGADVKLARITVDYTQTTADAPVSPDQFAFTPPPTARETHQPGGTLMALMRKPVPHFQLSTLDGNQVSDADLHGSVYVLDFWATWCQPCVMSLPGLDDLYKKIKSEGVKFFAVNQAEDVAKVKDFISRTKLTVPVLLDSDGKVNTDFGANEVIPATVIVGRDGVVRKVFIGFGPGRDDQIAAAIDAALHAPPAKTP